MLVVEGWEGGCDIVMLPGNEVLYCKADVLSICAGRFCERVQVHVYLLLVPSVSWVKYSGRVRAGPIFTLQLSTLSSDDLWKVKLGSIQPTKGRQSSAVLAAASDQVHPALTTYHCFAHPLAITSPSSA